MVKTTLFTILVALLAVTEQVVAFSPLQVPRTASRPAPSFILSAAETDEAAETKSPFDAYQPGQSEVVYQDTASGEGDRIAEEGDVLTISYDGTLYPSGKKFNKNDDFVFEIGGGNALPGFETALKGTKVGTKRTLRIPPSKAYGDRGVPSSKIPPNADLQFECEVKGIARGQPEMFLAKVGTGRLLGLLACTAVLALSPLLPN